MSFAVIDIVFIVIILVIGFTGLKRGFFTQLITIIGLAVGLFSAYFFSDDLSPYLMKVVGEQPWLNLLSFILILVVILLLTALSDKILDNTLEGLGADGLDKILGFVFGAIQGTFLCIGITALLLLIPVDTINIFEGSMIGSKFVEILPELEKILPNTEEIMENFGTEI